MGTTSKRGYYYPDGNDEVSLFPDQHRVLAMTKIDTDMHTALTATLAAARLPLATTKANGAMSAADKVKLNGIAAGSGGPVTSANITDATPTGRSVLTAASAAAARTALGAGTSSAATGTAGELNTGTATTARTWTAKVLSDYVAVNGGGGTAPAWTDGAAGSDMVAFKSGRYARVRDNGDGTGTVSVRANTGNWPGPEDETRREIATFTLPFTMPSYVNFPIMLSLYDADFNVVTYTCRGALSVAGVLAVAQPIGAASGGAAVLGFTASFPIV